MSLFGSFSLNKRKKKNTLSNDLLNALSDSLVVMCGELRKKGKVNTSWKSRWCELSFHEQGISLSYYISQINKTLCGSINTVDIFQLKVISYTENAFDDYKLPPQIERDTTPDLSDLDYSFMLCTLTREYILAAPNKREFNRWIDTFHKYICGPTLHQGFLLLKREKTSNTWDKRYFELNEYNQLKYYEHETKKASYIGAICLYDIGEIKTGKIYDDTHQYTLNFHSAKSRRKWVICCDTKQDRDTWHYVIQQTRPSNDREDDGMMNSMAVPSHHTHDHSLTSQSRSLLSPHHDRDMFSETSIANDIGIIKCANIKSCQALNNICAALNFFSVMISKKLFSHDAHGLLIHYFEHESGKTLLNDYQHLLSVHLNHNRESHKAFTEIYNKIRKFTACDFGQCVQYNRNTRLREHQKMGRNDAKITFYIDVMDTIHCYFMHSYDMGYRLKNYVKDTNDYHPYFTAIRDVRNKNKPKNTERFTIHVPETQHNKGNVWKIGQRLNFWEEYDEYYVSPHFATLKIEMIEKISSAAYDFTLYKAQQYLQCEWAKRIKITLEQILAVMVYIDYDIFSRDMRKVFIGIGIDNEPQWMQNIGEYAHLAKLLTEVVDGFGRNGINQHKNSIPTFYAALYKKEIQNINTIDLNRIILCGVHSSTSSIEVIVSNNRGIIMELKHTNNASSASIDLTHVHRSSMESQSQWPSWQNTTYFECSFLSAKGYENEILFTNTFSPLSVAKIKILDEKNMYWMNCKPFISALILFKMMIRGADGQRVKHAQRHAQIVLELLKRNDQVPQIISNAFELIKKNTNHVTLDMNMLKGNQELLDYFMVDETQNIFKYNELNRLFPNVEVITTKSTGAKIVITEPFFNAVYEAMDDMTQHNEWFQQIVVINPKIKCDLNEFKDKFDAKEWCVQRKKYKLCITRKDVVMSDDTEEDEDGMCIYDGDDDDSLSLQNNTVPQMDEDDEEQEPTPEPPKRKKSKSKRTKPPPKPRKLNNKTMAKSTEEKQKLKPRRPPPRPKSKSYSKPPPKSKQTKKDKETKPPPKPNQMGNGKENKPPAKQTEKPETPPKQRTPLQLIEEGDEEEESERKQTDTDAPKLANPIGFKLRQNGASLSNDDQSNSLSPKYRQLNGGSLSNDEQEPRPKDKHKRKKSKKLDTGSKPKARQRSKTNKNQRDDQERPGSTRARKKSADTSKPKHRRSLTGKHNKKPSHRRSLTNKSMKSSKKQKETRLKSPKNKKKPMEKQRKKSKKQIMDEKEQKAAKERIKKLKLKRTASAEPKSKSAKADHKRKTLTPQPKRSKKKKKKQKKTNT